MSLPLHGTRPLRPSAGALLGLAALALSAAGLLAGCGSHDVGPPFPVAAAGEDAKPVPGDETAFEVPPPPFRDPDLFPCTQCHNEELPPNPTRRVLSVAHDDIVLHHDEEHRWCLDCHDAANRDMLRLANGTLVKFEESYRLCGQCHGDKYRDWRAGAHGRRTGRWDGEKKYLLCVHCHYSHAPRFEPRKPFPPPVPPRSIK